MTSLLSFIFRFRFKERSRTKNGSIFQYVWLTKACVVFWLSSCIVADKLLFKIIKSKLNLPVLSLEKPISKLNQFLGGSNSRNESHTFSCGHWMSSRTDKCLPSKVYKDKFIKKLNQIDSHGKTKQFQRLLSLSLFEWWWVSYKNQCRH